MFIRGNFEEKQSPNRQRSSIQQSPLVLSAVNDEGSGRARYASTAGSEFSEECHDDEDENEFDRDKRHGSKADRGRAGAKSG